MKIKKDGFIAGLIKDIIIIILICLAGLFCAFLTSVTNSNKTDSTNSLVANSIINNSVENIDMGEVSVGVITENIIDTTNKIALADIPEYKDMPYVEINNNVPFFDDSELSTTAYEKYSDLDKLGRVGIAVACIEKGMDDGPRSNISDIHPTGWQSVQYEGIDGNSLYNRCHLIANQLTGENDNEKNLITGTRYMNTQGMERFESQVADYINTTDNHVLYRVTPMFEGDDLLAKGVLIEAKSVEDKGEGIKFNVFCYNVQPSIIIDYKTGESKKEEKTENNDTVKDAAMTAGVIGTTQTSTENKQETPKQETFQSKPTSTNSGSTKSEPAPQESADNDKTEYVLNTSTKKFHYTWCSSIRTMKAKNRQNFTGTRSQVINKGYQPCKRCNP